MKFCPRFYEYLYVDDNAGSIAICQWMEHAVLPIGNLIDDDVNSAYNSEHANYLRGTMDDQTFKHCRMEACPYIQNSELEEITPEEYERRKKSQYSPSEINMAYDFVCNQSCETCRTAVFVPPKNYAEQMNAIREKLAPYINSAKRVTASGHGDPFASKYMMEVLENLHPTDPDFNILLETNGVFFDEAHWERIKHLGKFRLELVVTINSFDKFTYRHISRGGDYEKMMHNLDFMSELRKNGDLTILTNSFVIQDRNFREIPFFIKQSFSDYAFDRVVLKPVYQWGTMDEAVCWFKDVLNPLHPYHAEYLEILSDSALKDPRIYNFAGNTIHEARPYPSSNGGVEFPYDKICKDSRIVLYGAGQIGREYIRQIKKTQYCEVALWVDKNCDDDCVSPPSRLSDMNAKNYDYVVLATTNKKYVEEMKHVLKEVGIPDERIVSCDC
ncbi:hypothetical protein AGMMS49975_00350 [Clostridia bacterium]|nr:hypothetical protein AGMMS49975_00350 [Clostridia bacterium]